MDRTEFEPYAKAIAEMESRKGSTTAVKSRDGVAQDAINAAQIFDELIEVELKKAQFALQTAHYRSRVDIPLRGPSPQSRVATLYGAWGDNVSTMLQFIYAPENLGSSVLPSFDSVKDFARSQAIGARTCCCRFYRSISIGYVT